MLRKPFLATLAAIALIAPAAAIADLNPGDTFYNPQLAGTGAPGDGGPYYTGQASTPAWVTGAPLLASLDAPISLSFGGTVRSEVRNVAPGRLGFVYTVNITSFLGPTGMVRVAPAVNGWQPPLRIVDAGSDGTGSSTSRGGAVTWTDGDAYFIERASSGAIAWQFGVGDNGTELRPGNTTARVWFEVVATDWFTSFTGLLDSGQVGLANILAPQQPIPEPAAVLLGALGLALINRSKRWFA